MFVITPNLQETINAEVMPKYHWRLKEIIRTIPDASEMHPDDLVEKAICILEKEEQAEKQEAYLKKYYSNSSIFWRLMRSLARHSRLGRF